MRANQGGRTLVIGGSRSIHGSVILTGLTQLRIGVEVVQIAAPKNLQEVIRVYSPNFILFSLPDLRLTEGCVNKIVRGIERGRIKADSAVIGADMSGSTKNFALLSYKLSKMNIHLTINSRAVCSEVVERIAETNSVIVLNEGEARRIIEGVDELSETALKLSLEKKLSFILVRKGEYTAFHGGRSYSVRRGVERAGKSEIHIISGLISGLIARGFNVKDSIELSLKIISKAEEIMSKEVGAYYLPEELVSKLPEALKTLNP